MRDALKDDMFRIELRNLKVHNILLQNLTLNEVKLRRDTKKAAQNSGPMTRAQRHLTRWYFVDFFTK